MAYIRFTRSSIDWCNRIVGLAYIEIYMFRSAWFFHHSLRTKGHIERNELQNRGSEEILHKFDVLYAQKMLNSANCNSFSTSSLACPLRTKRFFISFLLFSYSSCSEHIRLARSARPYAIFCLVWYGWFDFLRRYI